MSEEQQEQQTPQISIMQWAESIDMLILISKLPQHKKDFQVTGLNTLLIQNKEGLQAISELEQLKVEYKGLENTSTIATNTMTNVINTLKAKVEEGERLADRIKELEAELEKLKNIDGQEKALMDGKEG